VIVAAGLLPLWVVCGGHLQEFFSRGELVYLVGFFCVLIHSWSDRGYGDALAPLVLFDFF
jgi:hypothetical protein